MGCSELAISFWCERLRKSQRAAGGVGLPSDRTDRQLTLVASRFAEFALACFHLSRYFRCEPVGRKAHPFLGSSIFVKENDDHAAVNLLAFDLNQAKRLRYVSKSGCTLS